LEYSIIMTAKTRQTSESIHSDRTVTSRNGGGCAKEAEEYPLSSRIVVIAIITKRNYLAESTVFINLLA
jgi:hypothetical protein